MIPAPFPESLKSFFLCVLSFVLAGMGLVQKFSAITHLRQLFHVPATIPPLINTRTSRKMDGQICLFLISALRPKGKPDDWNVFGLFK